MARIRYCKCWRDQIRWSKRSGRSCLTLREARPSIRRGLGGHVLRGATASADAFTDGKSRARGRSLPWTAFLLVACGVRSSWLWSGRGTIRIAVSLERLQANVIGAALLPSDPASGGPSGSAVGAGGVARMAAKEAMGEDLPPAELYCKVWWWRCR